ncbi:MAG: PTS sugar transporter subunit IIA, partial [Verrucomicrobiota bacterium]|nr:PTS sugar transporter subunit IIA [Verrucomicrobiota bacterium]
MNGNGGIKFSSLFSDKEILCNTTETNRDSVIGSLLKKLAIEKGIGNYVEAYKQVIEREEISSTVIAPGIAMPHARSDAVDTLMDNFRLEDFLKLGKRIRWVPKEDKTSDILV